MMTETKKRIQHELDETTRQYANGLISVTEKLCSQIALIEREREVYLADALKRHAEIEPNSCDYRKAVVLYHSHKSFDKAVDSFNFTL